MNERVKLEPCPFCGGRAEVVGVGNTIKVSIMCRKCGGEGPHRLKESLAVRAWNRRSETDPATYQAQSERIAELESENERLRRIITQAPADPAFKGDTHG